jgi:hypothetical protein
MSGRKAKEERRKMRESGVFCLNTRTGRKAIRRQEALQKLEEHAAAVKAEAERWEALTPEQKEAEREQEEKRARESERKFRNLMGMVAMLGAGLPSLPPIHEARRQPYQRRGR